MRTDRAGFVRHWGVAVFVEPVKAPWVSLGMHFDWHTPTLTLYVWKFMVTVGRNEWEPGWFHYHGGHAWSGHTDQCMHFEWVEGESPRPIP